MVSVSGTGWSKPAVLHLGFFFNACENPQKVSSSSFCGKLAPSAVFIKGKWTPPFKDQHRLIVQGAWDLGFHQQSSPF